MRQSYNKCVRFSSIVSGKNDHCLSAAFEKSYLPKFSLSSSFSLSFFLPSFSLFTHTYTHTHIHTYFKLIIICLLLLVWRWNKPCPLSVFNKLFFSRIINEKFLIFFFYHTPEDLTPSHLMLWNTLCPKL